MPKPLNEVNKIIMQPTSGGWDVDPSVLKYRLLITKHNQTLALTDFRGCELNINLWRLPIFGAVFWWYNTWSRRGFRLAFIERWRMMKRGKGTGGCRGSRDIITIPDYYTKVRLQNCCCIHQLYKYWASIQMAASSMKRNVWRFEFESKNGRFKNYLTSVLSCFKCSSWTSLMCYQPLLHVVLVEYLR